LAKKEPDNNRDEWLQGSTLGLVPCQGSLILLVDVVTLEALVVREISVRYNPALLFTKKMSINARD
jgi:ABC-type nickel/cobalt efflux system permease component RcnA